MKKIVITALTALTFATGIASAATSSRGGRPDNYRPASAVHTIDVRADSVLTAVELSRASIEPDTIITITAFPTKTTPKRNNQDR